MTVVFKVVHFTAPVSTVLIPAEQYNVRKEDEENKQMSKRKARLPCQSPQRRPCGIRTNTVALAVATCDCSDKLF